MIFSGGINFGKPNCEFILESDENGVCKSCRNVKTGVNYVGAGAAIAYNIDDVEVTFDISLNEVAARLNNGIIPFFIVNDELASIFNITPCGYGVFLDAPIDEEVVDGAVSTGNSVFDIRSVTMEDHDANIIFYFD